MPNPIRVLLADDQQIVRAGIRILLERAPGLVVVGEATNQAEALVHAKMLAPEVIVLDFMTPPQGGLALIAALRQQNPATRILVLTSVTDDDLMFQAIQAGAAGYLLKTMTSAQLRRSIYSADVGELSLPPRMASKLIYRLTAPRNPKPLSKREGEILQLVARGVTVPAIAKTLFIDTNTVHTYLYRMFRKLRVATLDQAARYALEAGLIHLEGSSSSHQQTHRC